MHPLLHKNAYKKNKPQETSHRKLPNFYEKVTDFLLESYRISKIRQIQPINEVFHNRLEMHKYRIFQKLSSPAQRSMAQGVKQTSAVLSTQL